KRLAGAVNQGIFTPISLKETVHVPTSNGGVLMGGTASDPTGAVYLVAHDNPGIMQLRLPNENARGGGPPVPPGQTVYEQQCSECHGADRLGLDGPALVAAAADPANNIAAGAPSFTAAQIRAILVTGKGRMPSFPHLTTAD